MKRFILFILFLYYTFHQNILIGQKGEEFPQIKINRIDASKPPYVKIYASFLDKRKAPVKEKYLERLEVYIFTGREKPKKIIEFINGKPSNGKKGEIKTLDKAGESISGIFIFAGHQDSPLRDGTLGKRQKTGAGIIFKKLSEKDRVNIIWYGDRIYSYIKKSGKEKELSNLSQQKNFCLLERFNFLSSKNKDENFYPCGLFNEHKTFSEIIQRQNYEGFFPNLFGLPDNLCLPPKNLKSEESNISAFDYALEFLLSNTSLDENKIIAILSDGKDGYLFKEDDCKIILREKCSKTKGEEKEILACIKQELEKLRVHKELLFKKKLTNLISILNASKTRVFSISYPTGSRGEIERLKVLSIKTGGTHREALNENDVPEEMDNLVEELTKELVISFNTEIQPVRDYGFQIVAITKPGIFKSSIFHVKSGKFPTLYERLIKPKIAFLEKKFGSPYYKIIIAFIIIISVVLIFFIGKGAVKIIKKIAKKIGEKG